MVDTAYDADRRSTRRSCQYFEEKAGAREHYLGVWFRQELVAVADAALMLVHFYRKLRNRAVLEHARYRDRALRAVCVS